MPINPALANLPAAGDTQAANGPDTQASAAPTSATPPVGTDGGSPNPAPAEGKEAVQTPDAGEKPAPRARRAATPPGGDAPPPPAKPAAPADTRTPQEIINDYKREEENQRLEVARKKVQDELREFRQKAPMRARDLMDSLAEELGIHISPEERKPFLDLIEEYGLKGEESARLELGDGAAGATERATRTLAETSNAFFEALDGEADMDAFAAAVEGKPPAQWVKEFARMNREYGEADSVATFAELGAERLGEAARGKFAEAAGKAETIEQVVEALIAAAQEEGEARPVGVARIAPSGGAMGKYRSLDDLNAAKLQGLLNDVEYLAEQNRLLGVH